MSTTTLVLLWICSIAVQSFTDALPLLNRNSELENESIVFGSDAFGPVVRIKRDDEEPVFLQPGEPIDLLLQLPRTDRKGFVFDDSEQLESDEEPLNRVLRSDNVFATRRRP